MLFHTEKPFHERDNILQTYDPHDSFIVTQGPTESTVEDFWRCVLDNNATVIVMLTSLVENGKVIKFIIIIMANYNNLRETSIIKSGK